MSDEKQNTPAEIQQTNVSVLKRELEETKIKLADAVRAREIAENAAANGLPPEVMEDAKRRGKLAGGAMTWQQCISVALDNYKKRQKDAAASKSAAGETQKPAPAPQKSTGKQ